MSSSMSSSSSVCACKQTLITLDNSSLAQPDLKDFTRSEVKKYFLNSYGLYELLFSAIKDESFMYKSPDRLRLPLIFYVAHTASVYINKLLLAGLIKKRVNMKLEALFELGVDEMCWDDTENHRLGGAFQWPSLREVMEYRKQVSDVIVEVIDNAPLQLPVTFDHPWWALFMGIEHERIHLDTSSVLLHQLPASMLTIPPNWMYAPVSMDVPAGQNELIKVCSGQVEIGKPSNFPSYGWDNEFGRATISVPEFEASKYLVTNAEFLSFVEDDGYQCKEFWTEEGWKWARFREAQHPVFWVCDGGCKSGCGSDLADYSHCSLSTEQVDDTGKYRYRAMFDVIDMPWDWPVVTNYHEMKAFCQWKGPRYRAPTEAEHLLMRGDPVLNLDINCDPAFNSEFPANTNLKYGSPSPVNMFEPSSTGHYDVYGNLWEWVEDHFNGLPGFKTSYLYDDFSTPFYDDRHNVLVGGSWSGTGGMASRFFRNWFRRHFFQHAGFRYVVSSASTPARLCKPHNYLPGQEPTNNPVTIPNVSEDNFHEPINDQFQYETIQSLERVLQSEYGSMVSCEQPVLEVVESVLTKYGVPGSRAVVFGSAGGTSTFFLTKHFNGVMGVDYSGRFVDAAMSIKQGKTVEYGDGATASLASSSLVAGIDASRASFKQFAWIPNEITQNDFVLFEFSGRLNEPRGWLRKLWETVNSHGIIIITTSETVDKDYIQAHLGDRFDYLEESPLPDSSATIWRLKD